MGLTTTIIYGAFASCKKSMKEVTRTVGKKCINGHSFNGFESWMSFCPKCGLTLVDDDVTAMERAPANDRWHLEDLLGRRMRNVVVDVGIDDIWIDNDYGKPPETCYYEIDARLSGYYEVDNPMTYISNFKEKFADEIDVLKKNYESIEITCGIIIEYS